MESYLVDVSKLRIPRPKFATQSSLQASSGDKCRGPRAEPPRDYNMDNDFVASTSSSVRTIKLQSDTEDIRQAIQEKL